MRKSQSLLSYIPFALLITFLFACTEKESEVDTPEMWGELTVGPYDVGFKTLFLHDASRLPIPYSDWGGKLTPTTDSLGRQMQINVWYPAKVNAGSRRLTFEHYVNLTGRQTDFSPLDDEKQAFTAQEFMKKTNALGGGGAFTEASNTFRF